MKNLFLKNLILLFMMAFFASCTVKEPHPSNEITSYDGLKIVLDWRTGSSSLQALEDADLDLFLLKGGNQVRWSENIHNFEMIILEDVFADGEYIVAVASHEVFRNTDFTVYFSDMEANSVISVTSDFQAGENDTVVNFVKVQKRGSRYTITQI